MTLCMLIVKTKFQLIRTVLGLFIFHTSFIQILGHLTRINSKALAEIASIRRNTILS